MGIRIRRLAADDYPTVIGRLDAWWGGRRMTDMLPRLFFVHFASTSLAAVDGEGDLIGFLVGFHSPSDDREAYVHFVGVDPKRRGESVGRKLYQRFIEDARVAGCRVVRAVTSPMNAGSIAFHRSLGFSVEEGPVQRNGIWVHPDYDGPGEDRVKFRLEI